MIGTLFWICIGFIVYAYLGYPVIITLMARLIPTKKYPEIEIIPHITLIIAAYNEALVINEKINNSLALDYPSDKLQIIVVADGSDDETPDIVRGYADYGVTLLYDPPRRGKAAAINRAVQVSNGEILVFSDANNHYVSNVLKKLIIPFADPKVGATSGSKRISNQGSQLGVSEGLYWRYESFIKRQETRLGCCTGVAGEILAVRHTLFEPLPENIINDDFYIAMCLIRRGYNIIFVPDAWSLEPISLSAFDERVRRTRIIAGRYQALRLAHRILPIGRPFLFWQSISHKFIRPLVPFAMLGALVTNILVVFIPSQTLIWFWMNSFSSIDWVLLLLQILFYMMAFIGHKFSWTGRLKTLLYLPTFLVNSNLTAINGLWFYLSGRQTNLWQRVPRHELNLQDQQGLHHPEDE